MKTRGDDQADQAIDEQANRSSRRCGGLRAALQTLSPTPLLVAIACGALGQYWLVADDEKLLATLLYAIGITMFLVAALTESQESANTQRQPVAPQTHHNFSPNGLTALAPIATVLLVIPWFTDNRPSLAVPGLISWLIGLALALVSALPMQPPLGLALRSGLRRITTTLRTREALAVGAITILGAALRMYDLERYPSGFHGDEGEFGLIAASVLQGNGPDPFGTAFLGDPALYPYLLAPFLAVFGQTFTAVRLLSAVSGILTLPFFYLLIRRLFGMPTALLALTLLATNAVHIHFSRLTLNTPEVPLLMCLTLYALWEGQNSRRGFWWLAAGVFGALTIYFHFAGRVTPLIMAAFVVYLLVSRPQAWTDWLRGAGWGVLGGIITLAPMAVHLADQPEQFSDHMNSRLIFNNWQCVSGEYQTSSLPAVLWGQLQSNLLAFLNDAYHFCFYPYHDTPMLAPILGPLFVFGLVLMLIRSRDSRYALLACFFWIVILVNGVISLDPPQPHRLVATILPALTAVALTLSWIVDVGLRHLGAFRSMAPLGGAILVVVIAAWLDCAFYFGPAVQEWPWEAHTVQGKYVAKLGSSYRVRYVAVPTPGYPIYGVTRFLAPDTDGQIIHNPVTHLPIAVPPDRDLAILVYPETPGYLQLYQSVYPTARTEVVQGHTGSFFTALLVSRDDVAQWQGLTARYAGDQRLETDPNNLGGGGDRYPTMATWIGSIYVERSGHHQLWADGIDAEVKLDGTPLEPNGRDLTTGWHSLEITGTLPDAEARVALRWQAPGQSPNAIPPWCLDARSFASGLHCQLRAADGTTTERRDRTIAFHDVAGLTGIGQPTTFTWQGTLIIDTPGTYDFVLNSTGEAELRIDGHPVTTNPGTSPNPRQGKARLSLAAGAHDFAVHYEWTQYPGMIEVLWTTPGAEQSIIPPDVFREPTP